MNISLEICTSLEDISPEHWNRLNQKKSPFLRHEFLVAMERHQAVGERFGWLPRFQIAWDDKRQLIGAMPMYEKDNSYGELVFDWAWANAYHQHGIAYYPKLVSAIPYTPATGQRILSQDNNQTLEKQLIDSAIEYCHNNNYSTLHCLFPDHAQMEQLLSAGLYQRIDVQYHWHNDRYTQFSDFLDKLRHSKRKKIKQERRKVHEAGITFRCLHGNELSEEDWVDVHRFYASTFEKKSGYATLNLKFWQEIGNTMGEDIVIIMAYLNKEPVACAINFRSHDTLYGRHWGCNDQKTWDIAGLHFETCYYQGIEYAIDQGLQQFEPGAQGEYKMSRGFNPSITASAHWIGHPQFKHAIRDHLIYEKEAIMDYYQQLQKSSAYKS